MYLCIGLVTCVGSINFISTLLPSKCYFRSICLDCFSHREWKGPVLESQVLRCDHTDVELIYSSLCSHWLQADISWMAYPLFQQILYCLCSWYWFISSHLSGPILLFIRAHSQSTHSHDTMVTELEGVEGTGCGRTEMKMMNAVPFIRCISSEHEIFSLYMNVQCHFLPPASVRKAFLISLWFLLHEWLMCSTKDM